MAAQRRASGELELGGVLLADLVRDPRIGTPSYVYDLDGIAAGLRELHAAFEGAPHLVAYALKANSAGEIIRALVAEGCGADIVSGGELLLALRCGVRPADVVYSGVAKADGELDLAVRTGDAGIGAIQLESVEEIPRVAARARAASRTARVSLRINPGVDKDALDTHNYIATGHDAAKFGIPFRDLSAALDVVARLPELRLVGISAHAGSQLTSTEGYLASARRVFELARSLRQRFPLAFVNTGGGFGIDYGAGCLVRPVDFVRGTRALQREAGLDDLVLYCEPGRSLVGKHAVLLSRIIQRKESNGDAAKGEATRRWLMIDAGMNDLMRPALYQARHRVVLLDRPGRADGGTVPDVAYRVVGPVCESSDDFGLHDLPLASGGASSAAEAGTDAGASDSDAVALLDAGAYGYAMASNYNGRALPAEVFLRAGRVHKIAPRRPMTDWVDERAS